MTVDFVGVSMSSFGLQYPPPPTILQLEVTKNCNLACIMCHKGQVAPGEDFVRTDITQEILDSVKPVYPYLRHAMLFGDGEPMVYRDFWDIVRDIRDRSPKCCIDFINNGTMMHAKNIEKCFQYKVSSMGLSLGGATPKSHDYIRKGSSLTEIHKHFQLLYDEKRRLKTFEPYVNALIVVMRSNLHELPQFVEMCASLGFFSVELQQMFVTHPMVENEVVSHAEAEPYIRTAHEIAVRRDIQFVHYPLSSGNSYRNQKKGGFDPSDPLFMKKYDKLADAGYCAGQQPWNTVYVLHDGKVVPDCHWWSSVREVELNHCGVLSKNKNILDIWFSKEYREIRERISKGSILPQCRGCGLAGGVVGQFRCADTDHTDPNYEQQIVQLTVNVRKSVVLEPVKAKPELKPAPKTLSSVIKLTDEYIQSCSQKKKAHRALVFDYQPGWATRWCNRIADSFEQIFVIKMHDKTEEYHTSVKVLPVKLRSGKFTLDYGALHDLIEEHQVDIIFQHAQFNEHSNMIVEFIRTRNFFIAKNLIQERPVDHYFYEGGFLRPGLEQLDIQGWNFKHSISHQNFPTLTQDEEEQLDEWIVKWRQAKLAQSKNNITRSEICSKFNINPTQKLALCAIQLPGDSVLLNFSPWCNTKSEFVEVCLRLFSNSDYHLIFRPHPKDKQVSICYDLLRASSPPNATFLENEDISVISYIEACDLTCVVNSTVGCEALALGKPVVCLGYAAYEHVAIGCHSYNPPWNLFTVIAQFQSRQPKVRAFLYNLIKTSFGKQGLSLKDTINILGKYYYL